MDGQTLYVTDLDGTLLGPDKRMSEMSARILGRLIDDGVLITCATGRSWVTAQRFLGSFRFNLPMILYNGTFTYDSVRDQVLTQHELDPETVRSILGACREHDQPPLLYWLDGGEERISWVGGFSNEGMDRFLADRPEDPRYSPRNSWEELPAEGVFTVVASGARATLENVVDEMGSVARKNCTFQLQRDTYHPQDSYLEIAPAGVSKAEAIRDMAASVEATRLVVFGDNLNDLSMFAIADECYAVSNAAPEVLRAATGIIGSNAEDGVARWLDRNAERQVARGPRHPWTDSKKGN